MDGAALLAAAIRSACQAGAPRRTIQAVAAAVTGVLVRPADARHDRGMRKPAGTRSNADDVDASDPVGIAAEALRAAKKAKRERKKERRRVAKSAVRERASNQQTCAADMNASTVDARVVVSARAHGPPAQEVLPPSASSSNLPLPSAAEIPNADGDASSLRSMSHVGSATPNIGVDLESAVSAQSMSRASTPPRSNKSLASEARLTCSPEAKSKMQKTQGPGVGKKR